MAVRGSLDSRRVSLVALAIATVAAAVVVPLALAFRSPRGEPSTTLLRRPVMPPGRVARLFVYRVVERRRPALAWDLVTDEIKVATSRAEWNRGTMRVVPVLSRKRLFVHLSKLERRQGELLLLVGLSSTSDAGGGRGTFMIRLVLRRRRWLVSYWGPAMLIGAPLGVSSQPAYKA